MSTRTLKFASAALVLVSYLALAITAEYSPIILLLPVAAFIYMPIGERLSAGYQSYRVAIQGVTMIYVASLPIFFRYTNLIHSVVALVIYIQLYTLVHEKKAKNYNHIVLMSFFLLLAACVVTPPPEIAIVLLLFLAASVATLIELEKSVARLVAPVGEPPQAQEPPLEVQHVPLRGRPRFGAYSSVPVLAITLILLTITATLFVAGPRTEASLFGPMEDSRAYTTGISSTIDLATLGPITRNTAPVMRVQFPNEPEGKYGGDLLWRMVPMEEYTGSGWKRRESRNTQRRRAGGGRSRTGRSDGGTRNLAPWVVQDIYYEKSAKDGVPHLPRAMDIDSKDARNSARLAINLRGEIVIVSSRINEPGLRYTVMSQVARPSAEELRSARQNYPRVIGENNWRSITQHNLQPETTALLDEITEGAETAYDRVVAVERWLSGGGFSYTLNVSDVSSEYPVDMFIRETKTGHCQLYASAMALLVRSMGIPARVVNGYRGGEWQSADKSYIVKESMAHLWVEVYFPGYNWVTFDPSPSAPEIPRFAFGDIADAASRFVMKARLLWLQNIVGYNPGNSFEALRTTSMQIFGYAPWLGGPNVQAVASTRQPSAIQALFNVFVLLAACVGLILLLRPLIPTRTTRLAPMSEDQLRAVRLHKIIANKLREVGLDARGKTVEEILPHLEATFGPQAPVMTDALTSYNAARFGGRSMSIDALATLRRGVHKLRKSADSPA